MLDPPTLIHHSHRFDYQLNQRFHQKFGNVVVIESDDNGDEKFHVQSKWTLVNGPKRKNTLKWRTEKLNIIFSQHEGANVVWDMSHLHPVSGFILTAQTSNSLLPYPLKQNRLFCTSPRPASSMRII